MSSSTEKRVLLVGAGGHARVCIEAFIDRGTTVVGAVSADGTGLVDLGVPMLGTEHDVDAIVEQHGVTSICVPIGMNTARQRVCSSLLDAGYELASAVSGSAVISRTAVLDPGVQLIAGCVVNAATTIGTGTIVNTNASVDHDCSVGDYVHIAPGVAIGGAATIGDRAFVGIGARVLPGISIGPDAVVGGGAVVIRDVAAGSTVVGNPARGLRDRDGTTR
ncbi:MAG: acetyltransferase [Acidimicrobiia bacterium]|nr:acetyltransferase [Acidimicrobiia bacterium]